MDPRTRPPELPPGHGRRLTRGRKAHAGDPLALLTPRQRREVDTPWRALQQAREWSDSAPVVVLDRCWLRLSVVSLGSLAAHLPPDSSGEAPELARYREHRAAGLEGWQAQQLCWEEFGAEACHEAQRRFWLAQEVGNRGWTLERYLGMRADYRRRWHEQRPRPVPLLVLAREGRAQADEPEHQLLWLCPGADDLEQPMRHTCA
ncbi:MAG: hypothetical protein ACK522_10940 [Synechococcaceae cyanobacterium]